MREILFKNLTGSDNRKRDLSIKEIVTGDGLVATVERRCVYFVREAIHLDDTSDVSQLSKLKAKGGLAEDPHHFHIFRKYDSETQEDLLICKVYGKFYIICDDNIFCISFVHSFKIRLEVDLSIKHQ